MTMIDQDDGLGADHHREAPSHGGHDQPDHHARVHHTGVHHTGVHDTGPDHAPAHDRATSQDDQAVLAAIRAAILQEDDSASDLDEDDETSEAASWDDGLERNGTNGALHDAAAPCLDQPSTENAVPAGNEVTADNTMLEREDDMGSEPGEGGRDDDPAQASAAPIPNVEDGDMPDLAAQDMPARDLVVEERTTDEQDGSDTRALSQEALETPDDASEDVGASEDLSENAAPEDHGDNHQNDLEADALADDAEPVDPENVGDLETDAVAEERADEDPVEDDTAMALAAIAAALADDEPLDEETVEGDGAVEEGLEQAADSAEAIAADAVEAPEADDPAEEEGEDEDAALAEAAAAAEEAAQEEAAPTRAVDAVQARRMVEAILFAASEPVPEKTLSERLPEGVALEEILGALEAFYAPRGVNLVKVAGKWSFRTAGDLGFLLHKERVEPKKLSRAAMETLAIIAYHQPVTRAEIEELRGVSVSKGTLDVLLEIGWVRMRGRKQVPGRPLTYGTSDSFLAHFGLGAITDLPGLEELKAAGLLDWRLPPDFGVPMPKREGQGEGDGDFEEEQASLGLDAEEHAEEAGQDFGDDEHADDQDPDAEEPDTVDHDGEGTDAGDEDPDRA